MQERCPLCSTELKTHLLQPNLSLISCPSTNCIYPFNLSIEQLHQQNLLQSPTNQQVMNMMKDKFKQINVFPKIADFITQQDDEVV